MRFRYSTEGNGKPIKKAVVYTQDEHKIEFSDVDSQAVYITERLKAMGYETYIVGGAVRDLIMGKKPKDFDIASAASPAKIKRIFRNSRIIGRRFRLVHVFFGPKIFEVSTFRSVKDGPTSNTFGTIEEDVLRRDFTINALFYDPQKQIVVDYVEGMKDIRKRRIRPIIPLDQIFTDDPVRMIRAVKYSAVMEFRLPFSLRWRIRKESDLLSSISPSRLTEEIFKIINSNRALEIVKSLDALGLYRFLQPRATELFRNNDGYKARYLKTLGSLNRLDSKSLPGETLSALIRDYLEDLVDWDGKRGNLQEGTGEAQGAHSPGPRSVAERCKTAFMLARQFVLPMNPPRMELDAALRFLFAEHGVTIKRSMFIERRRRSPKPAGTDRAKEIEAGRKGEKTLPQEKGKGPTPENREAPKKRRPRKKSPQARPVE